MKTPKPVPKKITFRDYKNFDPEKFNDEISKALCESNIENDIGNENLNTATETLTKIISKIAEKHAPLVTKIIREKKDPPWYNKDIKERIKSKNLLLQDFYISRHPSLKKRLRRENNRLTYLKYNAKSSWIIKQIEKAENDISELWKLLNFLTNKRKPEPIEPDNINQEKANKYNRFFATVGINIQKSLSNTSQSTNPKTFPKYKGPKFKFKAIAPKYIKKLINEINPKVATGIDGIPSKLIKACKNSISPFICKLINLGYSINKFPDSLKIAIIKPIFKSGDQDDISNYRPISILPIISKFFERSAVDQIVQFLEDNQILSPNQHAYRKLHSTTTCLFEIVQEIYKAIDKKQYVAIASLDLSKAFDSISHELLLKKLSSLGIDPITWIKSYLTNRSQKTKFESFTSDPAKIESGIP